MVIGAQPSEASEEAGVFMAARLDRPPPPQNPPIEQSNAVHVSWQPGISLSGVLSAASEVGATAPCLPSVP